MSSRIRSWANNIFVSVDLVARLDGDFRLASLLSALKAHVHYETEWGSPSPHMLAIDYTYCTALRIRNNVLQRLVRQAVKMGVLTQHTNAQGLSPDAHVYEVHLERIEQLECGT